MSTVERLVKETLKEFAQTSSHRTARRLKLYYTLVSAVTKMLNGGDGWSTVKVGAVEYRLSLHKAIAWANKIRYAVPVIWVDPTMGDLRVRKPRKNEIENYTKIDDILDWVDSTEAACYICSF